MKQFFISFFLVYLMKNYEIINYSILKMEIDHREKLRYITCHQQQIKEHRREMLLSFCVVTTPLRKWRLQIKAFQFLPSQSDSETLGWLKPAVISIWLHHLTKNILIISTRKGCKVRKRAVGFAKIPYQSTKHH